MYALWLKCGVSLDTISRVEGGETMLGVHVLAHLAWGLGNVARTVPCAVIGQPRAPHRGACGRPSKLPRRNDAGSASRLRQVCFRPSNTSCSPSCC